MADVISIPAEEREGSGTAFSRRLRREGKIPAVLYGAGRPVRNLAIDHDMLLHSAQSEAFYSSILELQVEDGRRQQVVLRDIQRHPFRLRLYHADFQRIKADEALRMTVPLHFVNEEDSPAGQSSDMVISHQLTEVEIEALPGNLPEYIEVDLGEMDVNDSVMLSDLKLPEGVALTAFMHGDVEEHDAPVASASWVQVEAEPEPEEAEAAEGEVEEAGEAEDGGEAGADDADEGAGDADADE